MPTRVLRAVAWIDPGVKTQNVLVQLDRLRTHSAVGEALASNTLRLHDWVYHFETGQVSSQDSNEGCFVATNEI